MASKPILRVTLLKISNPEDQTAAVQGFNELAKTAVKDNAPYMLSPSISPILPDTLERSHGFTIVAKNAFKSKEDMDYYDSECEAHKKFKEMVGGKLEGGRAGLLCVDWEGEGN
ncbi:hypothetical protein MMC08_000231 [Hypocenomyce scalaris]|nr:hypothetical protein [Hypocenomyce scalaris]